MKKSIVTSSVASLLCIAAIMLATVSCQWKKSGNTGNSEQVTDSKDIVADNLDSLHITNMPDSVLRIKYNFQFLKSTGSITDSINAAINQFLVTGRHESDIRQAILDALTQEESAMKAEIQEFYEPDDETYGHIKYEIARTGHFISDAADSVIVYQGIMDIYTGGAHGSYTPLTLNMSKKTGCIINFSDVFDISCEQEILDLMLAQLLKDNGCSNREELMEKTGLLTLGELQLSSNFHLGKDAITFCFGQYEIAPYSSGITYISLGYDALKQYLKHNN